MAKDKKKLSVQQGIFIAGVVIALLCFGKAFVLPQLATQNAEQSEPEQTAQVENTSDNPEADVRTIDDESKKQIEAYDDTQKEVIGILEASLWQPASTNEVLTFKDNVLYDTKGKDKQDSYAFVLKTVTTDQKTDNDATTYTYTGACSLDGTEAIFNLTTTKASSGNTPYILKISSIASNTEFIQTSPAKDLDFAKFDDKAIELLDGKKSVESLKEKITEYCQSYYPTTTKVNWDRKLTVNYAENTVELTLTLNNASKTPLKISHAMGIEGNFELMK